LCTLKLFISMVMIASVAITSGCQADKKPPVQSSSTTLDGQQTMQFQWSLSKTPDHWKVSVTPSSKINEYKIDFDYLGESAAISPSLTLKDSLTVSTGSIDPHTKGFVLSNVHFQDKKITHEYILKWEQDNKDYEESAIVNITTNELLRKNDSSTDYRLPILTTKL
jgi:hypothetical protein